jgi:hypothetical protein
MAKIKTKIEHIVKKRRRLTKNIFNILIESSRPIEDRIDEEIQDIYDNYLEVNETKRPNENMEGNIKNIEPILHKIGSKKYQFILNVSSYTLLKFNYSRFCNDLNKIFAFPIGTIKVKKLEKDEIIKIVEKPKLQKKEVTDDIPKEIIDQIDKSIENDDTIPLKVPKEYIEALEDMENSEVIPIGTSSLPQMSALENIDPNKNGVNKSEVAPEKKENGYASPTGYSLNNILFGVGGLVLGAKIFSSSSNQIKPTYLNI